MAKKLQEYDAYKDPSSILDYGRNWGDAVDGATGYLYINEVIQESIWIITSDREKVPTLIPSEQGTGISDDKKMTAIFLEGGTPGVSYKLINEITTLDPNGNTRTERKTGIIRCCLK